jgi:hypothetical protein
MADKKISQLSPATVPLAGSEVLPVVQSNSTLKVSVSDLTAGRQVPVAGLVVTGVAVPANGVYLPAANEVGISTGSVERVRVSANGVGIGTATLRGNLDVGHSNSSGSVTTAAHIGYSAANYYSYRITNTINAGSVAAGDFAIERGNTSAWLTDLGIDDAGNVTIGGGALATTATNRFFYAPTCAGVPTGVPTAKTGFAPVVIDTTNHRLYFYSGGSWRNAGP